MRSVIALTSCFIVSLVFSQRIDLEVDSLLDQAKITYQKNPATAYNLEIKALDLSTKRQYPFGLIKSNYYLGFYYNFSDKLDYGKSVIHYLESIRYAENHPSDIRGIEWAERACLNLGIIFRKHQSFDLSIGYYKQGLSIAHKQNDTILSKQLIYSLQNSLEDAGKFDESIEAAYKLISISKKYSADYFRSLTKIGVISLKKEDYKFAIQTFEKVNTESLKAGHHRYFIQSLNNLGWSYRLKGEMSKALDYYEKSLTKNVDQIDSKYWTHQQQAEIFLQMEKYNLALSNVFDALSLLPEIEKEPDFFEIYKTASIIYDSLNQPTNSAQMANRFIDLKEEYYKNAEEIRIASQQYNMQLIVANYYQELEAQQKALKTKNIMGSIIVGLGTMLLMFVGYHFAYRYKLKRILSKEIERLKWID